MEIKEILSKCDHTLLRQDCTAAEIRTLCDQAIQYGCASVCIPPCHVAGAKKYVGDRIPVCTVIGFPNGYMSTATKVFEAEDAIRHGADEIDMVVNLSMVKDGCWGDVLSDIKAVRKVTKGKILKVIIETCLLTENEKVQLCAIVSASGADYIKTSTGFSTGGATFADVALLRRCCDNNVKVKASGGISSLEDAERFVELGADRLGTSRIVKIAIAQEMLDAEKAQRVEAVPCAFAESMDDPDNMVGTVEEIIPIEAEEPVVEDEEEAIPFEAEEPVAEDEEEVIPAEAEEPIAETAEELVHEADTEPGKDTFLGAATLGSFAIGAETGISFASEAVTEVPDTDADKDPFADEYEDDNDDAEDDAESDGEMLVIYATLVENKNPEPEEAAETAEVAEVAETEDIGNIEAAPANQPAEKPENAEKYAPVYEPEDTAAGDAEDIPAEQWCD